MEASGGLRPGQTGARAQYALSDAEPTGDIVPKQPEPQRRQRFDGKYPRPRWSPARNGEILGIGYAPSEYRKKPWPIEVLLEGWCPLLWEAHLSFASVAKTADCLAGRGLKGAASHRKINRAAGGTARRSSVKQKSASRQENAEAGDDRGSIFLTTVSLEGGEGDVTAVCGTLVAVQQCKSGTCTAYWQ